MRFDSDFKKWPAAFVHPRGRNVNDMIVENVDDSSGILTSMRSACVVWAVDWWPVVIFILPSPKGREEPVFRIYRGHLACWQHICGVRNPLVPVLWCLAWVCECVSEHLLNTQCLFGSHVLLMHKKKRFISENDFSRVQYSLGGRFCNLHLYLDPLS